MLAAPGFNLCTSKPGETAAAAVLCQRIVTSSNFRTTINLEPWQLQSWRLERRAHGGLRESRSPRLQARRTAHPFQARAESSGREGYSERLEGAEGGVPIRSASQSFSSEPGSPSGLGVTEKVVRAATVTIVGGFLFTALYTLATGGPAALTAAVTKSGFAAAFSLIFVSEIGDKTFFIAALLAMKHNRVLVLAGASAALGLMSVISVAIGRLFRRLPAQLSASTQLGEYLAVALLVWFGFRSIQAALKIPPRVKEGPVIVSEAAELESEEEEEPGELAEAAELLKKVEKILDTPLAVFTEAFTLVFLAEWGDRSMLATIALGAAQSPVGVALGATLGHVGASTIAVLGGALLAKYISERMVGLVSGFLFLAFAAATLFGVF
eukprot:TRINITY_DN35806_c0_g1_i1.p1 TRINITY_DN35806_c0_g1~~TRINITY_DN35806_c0_g1_i1.p1  ORF type:complete len:382 (-),score=63.47 TRINITY_DN35806_c0_g1_i1:967-2112(-)